MNRIYITVMAVSLAILLCLLVGCGGKNDVAGIENGAVGGINDEQIAQLQEVFGLSEEEIAAMPEEELDAILCELGYAMGDMGENSAGNSGAQNGSTGKKGPTLSDVSAGGKYVVTIGDSMWWNYLELHYENGVLQKIVTHFQKSSEEEPEIEVLEGDAARAYSFYWIDFNADPTTIAGELADKVGYTSVSVNSAQ